jgi:hypothetical protein
MYDLIYANGDSYTAGSGLAQHLYNPTGPLSADEVTEKCRLTNEKRKNKSKEDWKSEERKNSYPTTLGRFANVPVINNALGGAGLANIALDSTKDLIQLSKQREKILAVIGLTNPQRLFYPNDPNNTLLWNMVSSTNEYTKTKKLVLSDYAEKFSNLELEIIGVLPFLGLIKIMDSIPNVDYILVETPAWFTKGVDPADDFKYIKDIVYPSIMSLTPNYNPNEKVHTACNHIIKGYHDDLAKRIYNKIWKKRN